MAITDTQKVDYLLKKLGYGVAKTDTAAVKSPSNESIASPLLLRGDIVWANSDQIPGTPPGGDTAYVKVYKTTGAQLCVVDPTATTNRTWKTNLADWIPIEFGSTYQIKVWAATSGAANPTATGTQLFPDGSGNNDGWYFDYQAGILNFADTNIPSAVSGKVIYIEGYRYIGTKGLSNALQQGFVNQGNDPSNWDNNYTFGLYYVGRSDWSGTSGTPVDAHPQGLLSVMVAESMIVQKYQPYDTSTVVGSEWYRVKAPSSGWTFWARHVGSNGGLDGGSY